MPDLDDLSVRALPPSPGDRRVVGIVGPPGAGKSTLAAALRERLGDRAAVLPMDGFHLAQSELERLGLDSEKGSPRTFDVAGFVSALERARHDRHNILFVPEYRRTIEEGIAGALAIAPGSDIVITEGNYLLLDEPGWRDVAGLLDEVWFLDPPATARREQLEARHRAFGKTADEAARWVATVDEPNALLILSGRDRADLVIDQWVS